MDENDDIVKKLKSQTLSKYGSNDSANKIITEFATVCLEFMRN